MRPVFFSARLHVLRDKTAQRWTGTPSTTPPAVQRACAGAGPLRHDIIDYTMKCRSSTTGSLWFWQALSFMVPARHTFTLFISGFCLTTMRLSRRFRVGGLLSGERVAAPPGRHRPGRDFLRLPRLHRAVEGRRRGAIVAGPCGAHKCAIHICVLSFEDGSFPPGGAPGCCARLLLRCGAPGCRRSAWGSQSLQDTRHNLAVPLEWFFARFSYWPVVVVRACFVF